MRGCIGIDSRRLEVAGLRGKDGCKEGRDGERRMGIGEGEHE